MDSLSKKIVDAFDELPLWSAPFGLAILDMVTMKHSVTALDVGFGTGFPLFELAGRFGESSTFYGIDLWEEAFVRAYQKNEVYAYKNIKMYFGDIEKSGFEDNLFDLIVSNNGLNNVSNLPLAISECARIMKPGAELIFTMNMADTFKPFYDIYEDILKQKKLMEEISALKNHIYEKRKPKEFIIDCLQETGLKIIEIQEKNFNWRFLDGTAFLNHYFIKLGFKESWEHIVQAENIREIFNEIESRLNDYSKIQGELSMPVPFICVRAVK